jgi:hypothetical protein
MWKWLAIAATAYGLLGLALMLASPPHLPHAVHGDRQDAWRDLQPGPLPGMPPGSGPLPDLPAAPAGLTPTPVLDFEQPQPLFATRPEQQAQVAKLPDGNHCLRWTPAPGPERFATLILPWRPVSHEASELQLRLRADREMAVVIGLREGDGSVYSVVRRTSRDWRELALPLKKLQPGPRATDVNNRLDLDQVQEFFIVYLARGRERQPGSSTANTIEVDEIRLK